MKFFIYSILIVMVLIGVNSAPKNKLKTNKKNQNVDKKCNQCRVKSHETISPVCGRLNDIEETFESGIVFECFAKCRKVEDFEFLYDGECKQTPEQCKAECDRNTPLRAPPACEGHPSGSMGMTTYRYEALLDCYINCPENNLNKLNRGPCISDRENPEYAAYRVLASFNICFNNTTPDCQLRQLKALEDYPKQVPGI